jgi:hypothetical protein
MFVLFFQIFHFPPRLQWFAERFRIRSKHMDLRGPSIQQQLT